jgi:hemolysin activation/secretion protein
MRLMNTAFAVGLALLSLQSTCRAQTTPDAGALMRQTEQALKFEQMQRNAQRRAALPPPMVFNEATQITASSVKFLGVKRLPEAQLQEVAQPYLGRALNQHDLHHLTEAVTEVYRHTGWIVQAYIPRQDLTTSELTIQVIESVPPSSPER